MNHLITSEQLKTQLSKVVIFDCRFNLMNKSLGQEQYRVGHIPGAYFLDLEKDLCGKAETHGGRHPLPDTEELCKKLRRAGVNQLSTIVVYDDSRMGFAAHAWWLLRYLGHQQVLILDGGFSAWVTNGGALDRREPAVKTGNFTARVQADWIVTRYDILQAGSTMTLIDSREAKRYRGEEEPIDPIAGHIPSALNYCWQEATTEHGFFKTVEGQQQRWSSLSKIWC